jgi:hypothetical protein
LKLVNNSRHEIIGFPAMGLFTERISQGFDKPVGFGRAARTRLFKLINKQNMALCTPL